MHILVECNVIVDFWKKVEKLLKEEFCSSGNLNPMAIIFNQIEKDNYHVANFICLVAKVYMSVDVKMKKYASKC